MDKEDVLLVEAEIDAREIDQAAQEESCGDDEQKREGYLGDDERPCQQSFAAYRGCAPPSLRDRVSSRRVARSAGMVPKSSAVISVTAGEEKHGRVDRRR